MGGPAGNLYQHCPHVKLEEYDVFTHAGPACYLRAPGQLQGAFALESAIDELAFAGGKVLVAATPERQVTFREAAQKMPGDVIVCLADRKPQFESYRNDLAAIANAVFNATGVRIRQLPMTPDRVLAALAEAQKGGTP
jgi:hypothetical protein